MILLVCLLMALSIDLSVTIAVSCSVPHESGMRVLYGELFDMREVLADNASDSCEIGYG